MTTFAVWESEYPDEGSWLYTAWTAKGAMRKYRRGWRMRGRLSDLPSLDACEMTPDMLRQREANN